MGHLVDDGANYHEMKPKAKAWLGVIWIHSSHPTPINIPKVTFQINVNIEQKDSPNVIGLAELCFI